MKDAGKHMCAILRRIKKNGCVLMLDFDGVLSPIVKVPSEARITPAALRALAMCVKKMSVAIVTGRPLADIERRVGLKSIVYAGSHGLEWKIRGRTYSKKISTANLFAFAAARQLLLQHARSYPQLFVEDNPHGLAFGYRSLSIAQAEQFRSEARAILEKFDGAKKIRTIDNLYTFEIRAASSWTKGACVRHLYNILAKDRALAVYVGDSLTDEDAFRALRGGITIRVGKSDTSAARYYFKSRSHVDRFLYALEGVSHMESPQTEVRGLTRDIIV